MHLVRLLLHACCGPCSLEPVRLLQQAGHALTIYYANSNIAPADEYAHRLATLRTWAAGAGVDVVEGAYDPAAWEARAGRIGDAALAEARTRLVGEGAAAGGQAGAAEAGADAATAGMAAAEPGGDAPESARPAARALALSVDPARREARCRACYRMRLEETARAAAAGGFDGIATTLSVSPYQYTQVIREETERAAAQAGVVGVFEDFRPYYDEATRRSRALGMYRQNYCGCRFSDDEAAAERAERKAERAAKQAAQREAHAAERAAEEQARAAERARRAAYDEKQARKRAILKALREQEKAKEQA